MEDAEPPSLLPQIIVKTLGPLSGPKPARLPAQVHRHTDAQTHRHIDAQTHRLGFGGLRGPAGCPDAGGLASSVKGEGQSAVSPSLVHTPGFTMNIHQPHAIFSDLGSGVGGLVASGCRGVEASPLSSWATAAVC